jgi:hypothetical protein
MNRIGRELAQLPESSRALPLLLMFSAILMGALFLVRLKADLNFDGEVYISAARKFAAGMYREGLTIYPMPIYPYLIALMHRIIPNWISAGRLISYFSITLSVIPLYLLSKDLFNRRAAFWGSIAFTLLPETLLHSNSVMRDPPFFLFFTWAVYWAQKSLCSKRLDHLLGAVLLACVSAVFRIEGLIVFPACMGCLIVLSICRSERRKDYLRATAVWSGLFFLILAAAWIAMSAGSETINNYGDWLYSTHAIAPSNFLESYHRVSAQLEHMQETAVNSDVGQHFADTARQLMPLIYLLGLLYMLSKVVFVANIIPLLWGVYRTRYTERHFFVLLVTSCLLVLTYGFFIWHDQILARYLFMPAVLLCPWVGFGIDRILVFAQGCSHKEFIIAGVLVLIFVVPALKFNHYFTNTDDLKSRAGSWIAKQEGLRYLKIVFSDPGVKFHADVEMDFSGDENKILHRNPDDKNFSEIARVALANKADVIVIYTLADRRKDIVGFEGYQEIKEFNTRKKLIKIYAALNLLPCIESPGS